MLANCNQRDTGSRNTQYGIQARDQTQIQQHKFGAFVPGCKLADGLKRNVLDGGY
jgi:hypothetical protein